MDLVGMFENVLKSNIGRWVAAGWALVAPTVVPPLVEFSNSVFALGWTDQQVSNFAIAGIVGGSLAVWQWIRNRGNWEAEVAKAAVLVEGTVGEGRKVIEQ